MNENSPNPNGRNGKEDHQLKIIEIFKELFGNFFRVKTEGQIKLDNNKSRYGDVVGYDENGNPTEIHQVGRTNKNGTPVSRERKAIEDIEKATGLKVIFHPLVILAIIGLAILYLIQQ